MKIFETTLKGLLRIEPQAYPDARGWFMETYNAEVFRAHGLPETFAQDNHSFSRRKVLRGLHYQLQRPQGKLVRCARGAILDVAVDIRRASPDFGKWEAVELTEENRQMLWVPPGFAHGFVVLGDCADVMYKCTAVRHAESERSIFWNDPRIGIDWRVTDPIVSEKDGAAPHLAQAEVFES